MFSGRLRSCLTLEHPIQSIDLSPRYDLIATSHGTSCLVWSTKDFSLKCQINRTGRNMHRKDIRLVRFTPCGSFLITCGDDLRIVVWSIELECTPSGDWSPSPVATVHKVLTGHKDIIFDAKFICDETIPVENALYKRVVLDGETAPLTAAETISKEVAAYKTNMIISGLAGPALIARRSILVTASADGSAIEWNWYEGIRIDSKRRAQENNTQKPLNDAQKTPKHVQRKRRTSLSEEIKPHRFSNALSEASAIRCILPVPATARVVVALADGSAALWDLSAHARLAAIQSDREWIASRRQPSTGGWLDPQRRHTGALHAVGISSDARTLATASNDATVKLWSILSWKADTKTLMARLEQIQRMRRRGSDPFALGLPSSGSKHTLKNGVITFDSALNEQMQQSPQNSKGSEQSEDHDPEDVDMDPTRAILRHTLRHEGAVQHVSFSKDGQFVISSSTDSTVKVWEVETGNQVFQLNFPYPVTSLAFQCSLESTSTPPIILPSAESLAMSSSSTTFGANWMNTTKSTVLPKPPEFSTYIDEIAQALEGEFVARIFCAVGRRLLSFDFSLRPPAPVGLLEAIEAQIREPKKSGDSPCSMIEPEAHLSSSSRRNLKVPEALLERRSKHRKTRRKVPQQESEETKPITGHLAPEFLHLLIEKTPGLNQDQLFSNMQRYNLSAADIVRVIGATVVDPRFNYATILLALAAPQHEAVPLYRTLLAGLPIDDILIQMGYISLHSCSSSSSHNPSTGMELDSNIHDQSEKLLSQGFVGVVQDESASSFASEIHSSRERLALAPLPLRHDPAYDLPGLHQPAIRSVALTNAKGNVDEYFYLDPGNSSQKTHSASFSSYNGPKRPVGGENLGFTNQQRRMRFLPSQKLSVARRVEQGLSISDSHMRAIESGETETSPGIRSLFAPRSTTLYGEPGAPTKIRPLPNEQSAQNVLKHSVSIEALKSNRQVATDLMLSLEKIASSFEGHTDQGSDGYVSLIGRQQESLISKLGSVGDANGSTKVMGELISIQPRKVFDSNSDLNKRVPMEMPPISPHKSHARDQHVKVDEQRRDSFAHALSAERQLEKFHLESSEGILGANATNRLTAWTEASRIVRQREDQVSNVFDLPVTDAQGRRFDRKTRPQPLNVLLRNIEANPAASKQSANLNESLSTSKVPEYPGSSKLGGQYPLDISQSQVIQGLRLGPGTSITTSSFTSAVPEQNGQIPKFREKAVLLPSLLSKLVKSPRSNEYIKNERKDTSLLLNKEPMFERKVESPNAAYEQIKSGSTQDSTELFIEQKSTPRQPSRKIHPIAGIDLFWEEKSGKNHKDAIHSAHGKAQNGLAYREFLMGLNQRSSEARDDDTTKKTASMVDNSRTTEDLPDEPIRLAEGNVVEMRGYI